MRRGKRWFRCSQTINTDPEIRQLKRDCGLTGFSMWLEILARTDGTSDGLWKGSEGGIRGVLAGVCESNTRGSARVLQYLTDISWITWQRGSEIGNRWGLIVSNHRIWQGLEIQDESRKKTESSPNPSLPSLPSEPSLPKNKNISPELKIKAWQPEDYWLRDFLLNQTWLSSNGTLHDPKWWEALSVELNGLGEAFLKEQFAKMQAWCMENPQRKPTEKGSRRFVRSWLERAAEQRRRNASQQRTYRR